MDDFAAGGAAAIAAITCMHPVDVVKTRLQFQGEGRAAKGHAYGGVLSSLVKIARQEGMAGLYRGIAPAYGLQFTVTAVRFGIYGLAKKHFDDEEADDDSHDAGEKGSGSAAARGARNFGLAAVSGACGGLLGTPFFALKTRAQVFSTSKDLAVGTQHAPQQSLWGAVRAVHAAEGLGGFFRGVNAFVPRVVMYGAAQLGVYDLVKPVLQERAGLADGLALHAATAVAAALAAVVVIQPFDFIAARLMNQPVDPVTRQGVLYAGFFDCARKSVRSEGISCLAKGGWANMCRMVS